MDNYFSNFKAYSENDIIQVTTKGVVFCDGYELLFDDSKFNYAIHNKKAPSYCIGERDITDYSFMLYDIQHPIKIKFTKKSFLNELFGKSIQQRFYELEKSIREHGYATMDLS